MLHFTERQLAVLSAALLHTDNLTLAMALQSPNIVLTPAAFKLTIAELTGLGLLTDGKLLSVKPRFVPFIGEVLSQPDQQASIMKKNHAVVMEIYKAMLMPFLQQGVFRCFLIAEEGPSWLSLSQLKKLSQRTDSSCLMTVLNAAVIIGLLKVEFENEELYYQLNSLHRPFLEYVTQYQDFSPTQHLTLCRAMSLYNLGKSYYRDVLRQTIPAAPLQPALAESKPVASQAKKRVAEKGSSAPRKRKQRPPDSQPLTVRQEKRRVSSQTTFFTSKEKREFEQVTETFTQRQLLTDLFSEAVVPELPTLSPAGFSL